MVGKTEYKPKQGDKSSSSSSDSRTYTIGGTGDFYSVTGSNWEETDSGWEEITGTYKIAGVITVEQESSDEQECTGFDKNDKPLYTGSSDWMKKVGYALTVSDGTHAAKFRYSLAFRNNEPSGPRAVSQEISDLEVYDGSGNLLYTASFDDSNGLWTFHIQNITSFDFNN